MAAHGDRASACCRRRPRADRRRAAGRLRDHRPTAPRPAALGADTPLFYRHMECRSGARPQDSLAGTVGERAGGLWAAGAAAAVDALGRAADLRVCAAAVGIWLADAPAGWRGAELRDGSLLQWDDVPYPG